MSGSGADVAEEAIRLSNRRRRPALPEADGALDRLKYEVADELGLRDDIRERGWGEMTTREVGTIGGHMVRKMVRFAEARLADSDTGEAGAAGVGARGDAP